MNHLIVLTLFVLFLVGVFSVYPEIVLAKHEESNSNKQKSDSNNNQPDTTTTTTDKQTNSDVIPIVSRSSSN